MKKIKFGDIIEFQTRGGLSYAQCTHEHEEFGFLIRIFMDSHPSRPAHWEPLALSPVRFCTFFPIRAAVRQKAVALVGFAPVALANQSFPMFRASNCPGNVYPTIWWVWDGANYKNAIDLGVSVRSMSDLGVSGSGYISELIDMNFTPESNFDYRMSLPRD